MSRPAYCSNSPFIWPPIHITPGSESDRRRPDDAQPRRPWLECHPRGRRKPPSRRRRSDFQSHLA
jgi:hypothetical protein